MIEKYLQTIVKKFKRIKEAIVEETPGRYDQLQYEDYRAAEQVAGQIISALIISGQV